jgi:CO/xanthine dehydrogenase Mo-binding subunit
MKDYPRGLASLTPAANFVNGFVNPATACQATACCTARRFVAYPFAEIVRIDTVKADGLPGVRAVVTFRDAPENPFEDGDGSYRRNRQLENRVPNFSYNITFCRCPVCEARTMASNIRWRRTA